MSQDRKTASGSSDERLVDRAEALLDEAVGQAAKGSYREAADKAQQALAIDPDNAVARDLLDSYRHLVTDDDERRRRRRSIAAAAAAIEEMVENDRLDEASSATDALAMQFGVDAPVEDLRRRIAETRAELLDFDELDAAIDSIRVTDTRPSQSGRGEPGGAIVAEVEEHLRAGRLDEASRAVARLEREPEATERALKLRTRIEEAMHVAAEHRREEEILIATAAIEERLRRGSIDDAAERLEELARRHGESAPLAELGQRLAEARALHAPKATVGAGLEDAAEPVATRDAPTPVFASMMDEESSGSRTRMIAIAAAVVVALGAGAWWLTQRGDDTGAPVRSEPAGTVASGVGDGLSPAGSLGPQPSAADTMETNAAVDGSTLPPPAAAPVVPSTAQQNAAAPPVTGAEPRRNDVEVPPPVASQAAVAPPPAVAPVPPSVSAQAPPPVEETESASAPVSTDAPAQPPSAPESTEVVVEAVPAVEIPPPPPPAPVDPPADSSPSTADAPAPAESAASAPPPPSESAPEPAAETEPAAVAEAPRSAAPPPSTGPVILGCGAPGVVCVKALQVPTPRYPAAARARRLSGNVVVMALVNEQGRVVQARVESGSFAFFNDAALDAARRATFQPATRQGVAGQSWARLTFRFEEQ